METGGCHESENRDQVLSLPTRDGNDGYDANTGTTAFSSKPTYEGWKQDWLDRALVQQTSSKPTYEGWKPDGAGLSPAPAMF